MKKKIVMLLLCTLAGLTGCSQPKSENNMEIILSETKEEKDFYAQAEEVVKVKMGFFDGEKEKAACSVNIPKGYQVNFWAKDEEGKDVGLFNEETGTLEDHKNEIEKLSKFPSVITATSDEGKEYYTYSLVSSNSYSIQSEKEEHPDGVELDKGYIYKIESASPIAFVYEISPDWTLLVRCGGEGKEDVDLKTHGEGIIEQIQVLLK